MLLLCLKRFLILSVFFSSIAFAENAPVYDVDNYPPQFYGEPVAAGPSSSTVPAQQTLTQEQRLMRIEQQIKNLAHSDSASKSEATQAEIQSLRGQVEELTHQLQQAQNQQRLMYSDMDKRLSQTSTEKKSLSADDINTKKSPVTTAPQTQVENIKKPASTPAIPTPVKATAHNDQPNVVEEQQIYQTAYDLIKAKKYNEAVNTLQKMLQKYPAGQFAANAHYWLGELYGLLNKNDESAKEFATIVKDYPDSAKVADAQLKLGLIYAAQFKWPDAKTAFKKVVSRYPGTASARLASEQLKQLKQAQANNR
jgi:tol-pal system protein YbgF